MRLVVCDANRILSEALADALGSCDVDLKAIAVTDAEECIAAVCNYAPDMFVLDVHLPEAADGLYVIRELRSRFPDTAVVVVGDISDPGIVPMAKKLGITGFLAKGRSVVEVADALHRIASDRPVFDPVPHVASRRPPSFVLTPREAEVLRRITAGQNSRQMADEMDIAVSTLRSYIKNVFAKIGVHSRLEAAAVASRASLFAEEPPPADRQSIFPPG